MTLQPVHVCHVTIAYGFDFQVEIIIQAVSVEQLVGQRLLRLRFRNRL
jgi:hypothetical protein